MNTTLSRMIPTKFNKTVHIENKPYEASIELARHRDADEEHIDIHVTIRNIVYQFVGTLESIIVDLPIAIRSMILSEPNVLLAYFENDIDIKFVDNYNALLILIKLIIGKSNYDIGIRCGTNDKHALYNLVLVKVDELNVKLEELRKENDDKDVKIKALNTKLEKVQKETGDKDVRIKALEDRITDLERSFTGLLNLCESHGLGVGPSNNSIWWTLKLKIKK